MNRATTVLLVILSLALASCAASGDRSAGGAQTYSWSIGQKPRLEDRSDFEFLMEVLRTGTEEERRSILITMQLHMDFCLPFIIQHLEDTDPFEDVAYPLVTSRGMKRCDMKLPSAGFNTGAALEFLLVYYFNRDPARKSFNKDDREGAVEVWNAWYTQRAGRFRWNSEGVYSTK